MEGAKGKNLGKYFSLDRCGWSPLLAQDALFKCWASHKEAALTITHWYDLTGVVFEPLTSQIQSGSSYHYTTKLGWTSKTQADCIPQLCYSSLLPPMEPCSRNCYVSVFPPMLQTSSAPPSLVIPNSVPWSLLPLSTSELRQDNEVRVIGRRGVTFSFQNLLIWQLWLKVVVFAQQHFHFPSGSDVPYCICYLNLGTFTPLPIAVFVCYRHPQDSYPCINEAIVPL